MQTPGSPFGGDALKPGMSRIVLVRGGSVGGRDGRLLGRSDEELSTMGRAQSQKAAELLLDTKVISHTPQLFVHFPAKLHTGEPSGGESYEGRSGRILRTGF